MEDFNNEIINNSVKIDKSNNMNIIYGESFMLQHFLSKKYL
jgi:hypothetical protein